MSVSRVSRIKSGDKNTRSSHRSFTEARWLARRDIRRAWLSYPLSGLVMLFFGLFALSSLFGLETQEASDNPLAWFFTDYIFVLAGCVLLINWISLDYLKVWTSDVFSNRSAFLRSLPLSTEALVGARAISMLAVAPLTVPAFFLPSYFFSDLGDLGLSYVWFVGIWLGWSILYAGLTLLCELGLSGRAYCWISFPMVGLLIVILLLMEFSLDASMVRGSASLVQSYGPIPALISLLVGAAGFWLFSRLTVRRLKSREVSS